MNKRIGGYVAIGVLAAGGLVVALWLRPAAADPVIARVDGSAIHQSQADARIEGIRAVHEDVEAMLGPNWRDLVFQSLIDDVIIAKEAAVQGLDVADEEVDAAVARLRDGFDADSWIAWLDAQGMDQRELERRIRLQTLSSKVYLEVTRDVQPSDDDLTAYYEAHLEEFTLQGEPKPFLEVRNSIEDTLLAQMQDRAYTSWLEQRRTEVNVEVLDDEWS